MKQSDHPGSVPRILIRSGSRFGVGLGSDQGLATSKPIGGEYPVRSQTRVLHDHYNEPSRCGPDAENIS